MTLSKITQHVVLPLHKGETPLTQLRWTYIFVPHYTFGQKITHFQTDGRVIFGMGGYLCQIENGKIPIAFVSHSPTTVEKQRRTIKKERYAIVYSVK